ncbi:bifunctional phosphoribosyl-AMP cyclohydrolase/phosphoribosyl-ATP diphosphatase HisIE [uncultured Ornithinimicrobium sp.]|uniref:bifunctional phosphoribosyl-AMP cyclohydrolase/phosphoribosyl-ATP diphosphatase HisIE n=1 Tax=uncultured Ornithinimicrobium sp. TaxID=259307 RepID=UPI0025992F6C|nr:bifunctional phosphoribosyl-AMP cyclohydrolase/phosphoribosyl-ATP diphosphatase HisIE [uncultured Ornithinimicrobium sp.]
MSTEETAYPLALGGDLQVADVDFAKAGGLVPGVVQDARTAEVLMVGFLDADALGTTLRTGLATFRSRSRGGLWTKGETSGHTLRVVSVDVDCDRDTLLIHALPAGPTCHTGDTTCFDAARGDRRGAAEGPVGAGSAHGTGTFLPVLDAVVADRRAALPEGSYTTRLFTDGVRRIAQKVGEEGVETALAGVVQDDEALLGESADLLYHLIVLLRARDLSLADVEDVLRRRHG